MTLQYDLTHSQIGLGHFDIAYAADAVDVIRHCWIENRDLTRRSRFVQAFEGYMDDSQEIRALVVGLLERWEILSRHYHRPIPCFLG